MGLKSSTKVDVNTHELVFTADAETFSAAIDRAFQRQKKNIQVPGFRKGKASKKLIEKYFGEGVFYEEAINYLINTDMPAAIRESELVLVDTPRVEVISADEENGVEYKAICITKPEVTISEYKGLKAPKDIKEVTEDDIKVQIEQIRQRNARIVSVDDRPAELNDEVIIDFEGFMNDEAFDGGKADEFPLKLGSGQFIPGFEDQIVGHSIGDEFDVNVTFPEEYQMEEYAGKPAVFKVKLHGINMTELPEIDDELIKDTTEFETIEEWKNDIKTKLEQQAETRAETQFNDYLMQKLIDTVECVVPKCMFDKRIDFLIRDFENSLKYQGMSVDIYLQYTGMDMDSFRETFRERAENEVKLRLALEKIADTENLIPTEEDINDGLKDYAEANNMSVEDVKPRIDMDAYITDLKTVKAADFVKENAIVDNTLVPQEDEDDDEE
ncbi:MAG: trigger factor [Clostridium sp.]|nr:trigger factor [Clostridium sp.]MCM1547656.1 trigger factor [Ruminococcus sp.]